MNSPVIFISETGSFWHTTKMWAHFKVSILYPSALDKEMKSLSFSQSCPETLPLIKTSKTIDSVRPLYWCSRQSLSGTYVVFVNVAATFANFQCRMWLAHILFRRWLFGTGFSIWRTESKRSPKHTFPLPIFFSMQVFIHTGFFLISKNVFFFNFEKKFYY